MAASIGRLIADIDRTLVPFDHALLDREQKWNLLNADWIAGHLSAIADNARRGIVQRTLAIFRDELAPRLATLFRRC